MVSLKRVTLTMAAAGVGALFATSALASGWDCTASCIGIYPRSGAMILLGEPQTTAGALQATQADAFGMLEDSCAREAASEFGECIQPILAEEFSLGIWHQDGFVEPATPAISCQSDASIPDNDPPSVSVDFVPPGGVGGG